MLSLSLVALALPLVALSQTYSATYLPSNAPPTTEEGQTGTNQCGTGSNQTSSCQNVYINSVDDFCLFAPPEPGPGSTIGETERIEVAWCIKPGYGTRLIPDGSIAGAHFVQTPDYVQVTGVGDLTKLNIAKADIGGGGELDPHGADGNGNPIGGLVFSSAFGGQVQQLHEWTNFMAADEFCIRGCKDGPRAPALCQHIYDVLGCDWNMPGNYAPGVFERCQGDTGEPMGVYGGSTFHQGDPATPAAHPAPSSSLCTTLSTIGNLAQPTSSSSSSAPSSSAPVSSPSSLPDSASAPPSAGTSVPVTLSEPPASVSTGPAPVPSHAGSGLSSSHPTSSASGPSRTSSSSSGTTSPTGATQNGGLSNAKLGAETMLAVFGVVAGAFMIL